MRRFPFTKLAIAQFHFLSLIIKDIERLRRLGQKLYIDERNGFLKYRPAAFDSDIEKNIRRAKQHEVGTEAEKPENSSFRDAPFSWARNRARVRPYLMDFEQEHEHEQEIKLPADNAVPAPFA